MVNAYRWASSALFRPQLGLPVPARLPLQLAARASSLSAIHNGIRRSERAQHSGERNLESPSNRSHGVRERSEGSLDMPATAALHDRRKQLEKLRREKAARSEDDIRQSRRKRFHSPQASFGKDSLVYQLKHGALKKEDSTPRLRSSERPRSLRTNQEGSQDSRGFRDEERSRSLRSDDRTSRTNERSRDLKGFRGEERNQDRRGSRDEGRRRDQRGFQAGKPSRSLREDRRPIRGSRISVEDFNSQFQRTDDRQGRDSAVRQNRGHPRSSRIDSSSQQGTRYSRDAERPAARESRDRRGAEEPAESQDADSQAALRRKGMMPMTVKYTTAASQFLYGRSVVKAALAQNRRQLYNLYVHAGEDRTDDKDHIELTALARAQGVPVTNISRDQQRLMDKMSMGRPHNGFVLEASPLPQPPVTSLGKLEQSPSKMGFHVDLGYQTKEDEAVNGTETFVPRASSVTPKPFVLLLHEILDPGNLGALLRTASYLGVDAVGITNRTSSGLTPVVLKAAAGAVEEVAIFTVESPTEFLENSKRAGWKVYAAVAPPNPKLVRIHKDKFVSTESIEQTKPLDQDPCVLVLGNEGYGLPKPIKMAADHEISVPRFVASSTVDSLNVSVAAGLLCHSFVKEKPALTQAKEQVVEAVVQETTEQQEAEQVF